MKPYEISLKLAVDYGSAWYKVAFELAGGADKHPSSHFTASETRSALWALGRSLVWAGALTVARNFEVADGGI